MVPQTQTRDNGEISPSILGCFPQVSDGKEVFSVSGGCSNNSMKNYGSVAYLFQIPSCPRCVNLASNTGGDDDEKMRQWLIVEGGGAIMKANERTYFSH